ncbi:FadR/GntR family transcriptional regulator [Tsukamurella tyrosinosolvens]|uniref:FadR/GntR family transcriptional regulator n=1 Tax=Tsukamurella tyrosinosolvens TaxID=57704 RepID=UPI000DF7117A|nr:FadR/GntR family transcriptional regulator [Tsukamurella tyrosinosolvens]RDB48567.1 FadR family transcriptional regulator [Tsukamurella tyrosinosolvens]
MARRRLSTEIVRDVLRKIADDELVPGDQLPAEAGLCAEYEVSRSVVRDALQALNAKGFLVVRQGSVATVAERHRWNVLDPDFLTNTDGSRYFSHLYDARVTLEPSIAAAVAGRADPEICRTLTELNEQLLGETTPERHAELDIAFHDALAQASGNPVLVSWHSQLVGLGKQTRRISSSVDGSIERAVFWHNQIIDAIATGDQAAAAAAMTLHLRQVQADLTLGTRQEESE